MLNEMDAMIFDHRPSSSLYIGEGEFNEIPASVDIQSDLWPQIFMRGEFISLNLNQENSDLNINNYENVINFIIMA